MNWLYLINATISVFALLYYFETTLNKVNQKHLMVLIFTTLASYCYAMLSFASSEEGFLAGFNIYFVCIILVSIIFILIVAELCGIKKLIPVRLFLFFYGIFLLVLVSTINQNGLYYKSFELGKSFGATYISKTYGPLHVLFIILVLGSNIACLGMIIISLVKRKSVSFVTAARLVLILICSTLVYLLPKSMHLNHEFMPFSFTIMDLILIKIFRRASIYDMSANLLSVYEQRNEYGYIALDTKKRFVGANQLAISLFPELETTRIDSRFGEDTLIFNTIIPWLDKWIENQEKETLSYRVDDCTVVCSIKEIKSFKKTTGYLIEMTDVTPQQKKIYQVQESNIINMATAVESRDNSTGGHIKRTSIGIQIFVDKLKESSMNFSDSFCKNLIKAAPMHDLGKLHVSDRILQKKGKFEPEEFEEMKHHAAEGARLVAKVLADNDDKEFVKIAVNIAHYHHEKWNGKGYPQGLAAQDIPVEARIMAFADVFDALVSKRCYKDAFSFDDSFEIIKNDLGSHFDPELGEIFLQCRPQLEEYYSSLQE